MKLEWFIDSRWKFQPETQMISGIPHRWAIVGIPKARKLTQCFYTNRRVIIISHPRTYHLRGRSHFTASLWLNNILVFFQKNTKFFPQSFIFWAQHHHIIRMSFFVNWKANIVLHKKEPTQPGAAIFCRFQRNSVIRCNWSQHRVPQP